MFFIGWTYQNVEFNVWPDNQLGSSEIRSLPVLIRFITKNTGAAMKIENKNGYIHQLPQSDTNHSGCCCRVHIKWPIQIQFLPRNTKTASHVLHYVIYNISYIRFIIPRDHSIPSISQVELPVSVSAIGHHRTTHSPSVLACARIKQNGHRQNFHPTQALCLNTQNKRSLFKLCRVWCGHYTISRHNILAESRENRGRMATESAHKESHNQFLLCSLPISKMIENE